MGKGMWRGELWLSGSLGLGGLFFRAWRFAWLGICYSLGILGIGGFLVNHCVLMAGGEGMAGGLFEVSGLLA